MCLQTFAFNDGANVNVVSNLTSSPEVKQEERIFPRFFLSHARREHKSENFLSPIFISMEGKKTNIKVIDIEKVVI